MIRSSALAMALSCGLTMALCIARPAHSAPAHAKAPHREPLAACMARQRLAADQIGPGTLDLVSMGLKDADGGDVLRRSGYPEDAAKYEAQRKSAIENFNPWATREFFYSQLVDHYCHGVNNGVGEPLETTRTVTIQGHVFYDGSVSLEVH